MLCYRSARNAKKYSCKWSTKPLTSTVMDTAVCWEQCYHELHYSVQTSIRYSMFLPYRPTYFVCEMTTCHWSLGKQSVLKYEHNPSWTWILLDSDVQNGRCKSLSDFPVLHTCFLLSHRCVTGPTSQYNDTALFPSCCFTIAKACGWTLRKEVDLNYCYCV